MNFPHSVSRVRNGEVHIFSRVGAQENRTHRRVGERGTLELEAGLAAADGVSLCGLDRGLALQFNGVACNVLVRIVLQMSILGAHRFRMASQIRR